jgi:hypothetical protein
LLLSPWWRRWIRRYERKGKHMIKIQPIVWTETPCPYCGEQAIIQCPTCNHTECDDCGAGGYCDCEVQDEGKIEGFNLANIREILKGI